MTKQKCNKNQIKRESFLLNVQPEIFLVDIVVQMDALVR